MKIASLTAALFGLSLSASFGGDYHNQPVVSYIQHGGHIETGSKESFFSRLAIAPIPYHCASHVPSIRNAAAAATTVRMLGKIAYCSGSSWLDYHQKEEIDRMIFQSGMPLGPDTLIVVLGYADRTGCPDVNVRLSEKRAGSVKNHIDHLNWVHRLGIQTTTVAMGEEIEFCAYHFGHNRVAEVWMLNLARPVGQVVNFAPPATHLLQGPAPSQVGAFPPQPFVTENSIIQAPSQSQVVLPQTLQGLALPQGPEQMMQQAPQQNLPQAPQQQNLPQAPQRIIPQAPQQNLPQQDLPQAPQQIMPQASEAPQQAQPQATQLQAPQPQALVSAAEPTATPHQQLAEFLERNMVLAPNADANEFARQLNLLKNFGSPGSN